ncbi:MAG: DegT/DnrJ/EryC1/StrS family aminotransferase [Hylemonella sp.]|nr:DegT/DnrJ/EryC1/StrS family aminotransferase [Hylemonella sp.]
MNPFQKKIPRGVIYHSIGESVRYLLGALTGPLNDKATVHHLETAFAKYSQRNHCTAFPFARTAIYFILKNLDLPKGSEVLLPPITIKGIVDVVLELGLTPRYVDVDMETVSFNIDDLARKITPDVRAAIVTPLFGLVPDMPKIAGLLRQHGIYIIEDFSQCLNGEHGDKRVGTFGDAAVYSASSIKTLDTLGGGFAITDDAALDARLKLDQTQLAPASRSLIIKKAWINLVRNVATTNPVFSLLTFPMLQMLRWISPSSALKQTGNRDKKRLSRLPSVWLTQYSSLQARIGLAHIDRIREQDKARIANVERIKAASPSAHFPKTTSASRNVYWQLILHADDAASSQRHFSERGIDVATSSLELVCALTDYPNRELLTNAQRIYDNGVFIPCYPNLTNPDIQRVIAALREQAPK